MLLADTLAVMDLQILVNEGIVFLSVLKFFGYADMTGVVGPVGCVGVVQL